MPNFSREGYDGTLFADYFVARDIGPGWFVFGRDATKYGRKADGKGAYVKLCGYVREGKARGRNGKVRIGWRTKREAQAWIDAHCERYPHLRETKRL